MQYTKIQGAFLRSIAFKDAEMAARGAWLTLNGFCVDQENGGRIEGCRGWNDRQWLSRADCLCADVEIAVKSELATWDGDDLLLVGYNTESEAAFQALSETNRARVNARWKKQAGDTAGTEDECRRNGRPVPPAMPPVSQTDTGGKEKRYLPSERAIKRATERGTRDTTPSPPVGSGMASMESIEAARVRQREEAMALHSEIEQSGRIGSCDPALLNDLRKSIAYNGPGHPPIGGPFSTTAKLRHWLNNPPSSQATA